MLMVKVFSATMARDREELGERITTWMRKENVTPKEVDVRQSSDEAFHCLTFVIWYEKP